MRLTSSDDEISDLKRYLFKWLDSNKDRNLLVLNAEADEILDKILTIFEGKVGAKLSQDEIDAIKKEEKKDMKNLFLLDIWMTKNVKINLTIIMHMET